MPLLLMSADTSPFPSSLNLQAMKAPLISATKPPEWTLELNFSSTPSSPDVVCEDYIDTASSLIDPLDEIDLTTPDDQIQQEDCTELLNSPLESLHPATPQPSLLFE